LTLASGRRCEKSREVKREYTEIADEIRYFA
jgi:hypothetical protein